VKAYGFIGSSHVLIKDKSITIEKDFEKQKEPG